MGEILRIFFDIMPVISLFISRTARACFNAWHNYRDTRMLFPGQTVGPFCISRMMTMKPVDCALRQRPGNFKSHLCQC